MAPSPCAHLYSFLLLFHCLLGPTHAALQTGPCSYSKQAQSDSNGGTWCINPTARASASVTFPALFPSGATFVYAVDDIQGIEITGFPAYPLYGDEERSRYATWESSITAWWLEYPSLASNANITTDFATDFRVFYTLRAGAPADGNGGCDHALGAECVQQLDAAMRKVLLQTGIDAVKEPLGSLRAVDAPKCPSDMFERPEAREERYFNDLYARLGFAYETAGEPGSTYFKYAMDVVPPGNASFVYRRTLQPEQPISAWTARTAVMLMVRYPELTKNSDWGNGVESRNETHLPLITSAFACAKPPDTPAGSSGGGGGGDGDAATGGLFSGKNAGMKLGISSSWLWPVLLGVVLMR